MKSNCAREAWDAYKKDPKHLRMCFTATLYSKWVGRIPRPVKCVARWLCVGWLYVFTWLHLFAFERWPHWYWCRRSKCAAREFVPDEMKTRRWIPPHRYEGHEE